MNLEKLHDFAVNLATDYLIKTSGVAGIESHRSTNGFPWCAYLRDSESLDELAGDKHLFVHYGATKNIAERKVVGAILARFLIKHVGASRVAIAWGDGTEDTDSRGAK